MRVLMPLPASGFDPTETGVPWGALEEAGHETVFATPDGKIAEADPRMLTGDGLGWARPFLIAAPAGIAAYERMSSAPSFSAPLAYAQLASEELDALVLPGGHEQGMKSMLESLELQQCIARHFVAGKTVAAICHGVLAVARSRAPDSEVSVLHDRRTTALTSRMELTAWRMTRRRLQSYYRTYPETVQDEVTGVLASADQFVEGPGGLRGFLEKIVPRRDTPKKLARGFIVQDGNYLSARWPGDAHAFSKRLIEMLAEQA